MYEIKDNLLEGEDIALPNPFEQPDKVRRIDFQIVRDSSDNAFQEELVGAQVHVALWAGTAILEWISHLPRDTYEVFDQNPAVIL